MAALKRLCLGWLAGLSLLATGCGGKSEPTPPQAESLNAHPTQAAGSRTVPLNPKK